MKILFSFFLSCSVYAGSYYSQCGQDQFIHENYFPYKKGGVFVDVGAHDGKSLSNTLFFEEKLHWQGVCIEPIPEVFAHLQKNRKAHCIEGCVSNERGTNCFLKISGPCEMFSGLLETIDPEHLQRIQSEVLAQGGEYECIEVNCYLLNDILEENKITHVNLLSLDTEGGEFEIIESIDFTKYKIDCITVENNFSDTRFVPYLQKFGYQHVKTLLQDMIFVHQDLLTDRKEQVALFSYSPLLWPLEDQLDFQADPKTFPLKFDRLRSQFDLVPIYNMQNYVHSFSDQKHLKKIICFEHWDLNLSNLPQAKLILFKWEAEKIPEHCYDSFSQVYTIDDELVDGIKYFKFYYPALRPMLEKRPTFAEKRLCTMVVSNWFIKERTDWLTFFATKPLGEFEFYGTDPQMAAQMYCGPIAGHLYGSDKINTLKNYRFCICFENTHTTDGYITEKIFDAFAAGCVPIYWGPDNITDYIPKNCFIDYRDFKNREEVYQYIKSMSENVYQTYLDHIAQFLKSDRAKLFSPDHFDQILYDAVK